VHHPKSRSQKVADDPKWKAEQEKQRREQAIANTTGIRTLAAITAAVPVRLMKRDLLFVAERLASLLDENRLVIVAKQYGIRKAKDSDSLGKLFSNWCLSRSRPRYSSRLRRSARRRDQKPFRKATA
jgi:ParB family transcriptional regulator, chromosome partitioning protein